MGIGSVPAIQAMMGATGVSLGEVDQVNAKKKDIVMYTMNLHDSD